jgi:SAM-dependent methyltransferase
MRHSPQAGAEGTSWGADVIAPACYVYRMSTTDTSSCVTRELAGKAWAGVADLLDLQLSPLGLPAIDALSLQIGESALDVGCGAGQSVLQLADRVGPEGRVTGVDIAPALLEVARRRAAGRSQVDFIECDALTLALPEHSIDCVFSRFGVMAFRDPVVAFSNFRRMMKTSGRLAFVCWRSLEENELDLLPLRAAGLEGWVDPTPFSFADPGYVQTTLQNAGFRQVAIQAHDEMVSSGDLDAMIVVLLSVGPLGKIIRENAEVMRAAAESRVRAALVARGNPDAVGLNAATWVVTARL